MDRAEKAGVAAALAGHAALFALLSLGFAVPRVPATFRPQPVEVSLVRDVAPEAAAPAMTEPPAASQAPEQGEPEDAPPPAPAPEKVETPAPTPPQPAPAKAAPANPAPAKPAPFKPAPPAPAPKPAAIVRPSPAPAPKPAPASKAAPATAPPSAKSAPARPAAPARAASAARDAAIAAAIRSSAAAGSSASAKAARPRGNRLGDVLAGLNPEGPSKKPTPPAAAKVAAFPTASIVQAIARQIQPCADRQVNPGPGANQIVTTLNIRLNEDGTLAATPTRVKQSGVDDENDRYAQRVVDLGIAAFKGCTPLRLPAEYYRTGSGGWNTINYQWKLR